MASTRSRYLLALAEWMILLSAYGTLICWYDQKLKIENVSRLSLELRNKNVDKINWQTWINRQTLADNEMDSVQ